MKGTADKEQYTLIIKILELAKKLTNAGYGHIIRIGRVKE